jgi:hypothetical protein
MNRAVVAFLDGRRLKGYLLNFSALKESFRLFSNDNVHQEPGSNILMKDLKAIFFVKDFVGDPARKDSSECGPATHGRKVVVTFKDGEQLSGSTEAYNPQKLGFFLFPLKGDTNNTRIFVVNCNVAQVQFAK